MAPSTNYETDRRSTESTITTSGKSPSQRPAAKLTLKSNHAKSLKETMEFKKKKKTIEDHNRRLASIHKWIKKHYPDYYETVYVPLTDEQKADQLQFYKAEGDFDYDKLQVDIIKAYISAHKIKSKDQDGKETYYSYVNLRKYSDAVKFGASRVNYALSPEFQLAIKEHLDTLKKENNQKKGEGKVEEREADPISFPLMIEICKWAVRLGFISLWAFTVLQWHCMARSINIGSLTLQNLFLGKDSIIIKFNSTKKDQKGEKVNPKNCFSNPFNYLICVTTVLGVYFAIFDEHFANGRKEIFQSENTDKNTAAHNYCENLVKLFKHMGEELWKWVRPGHANGHGIRKGSSIHVTSASTCPPPVASVARRGEWSLGKIFDIYWMFAEAGDQYCGRILAGLDPMTSNFDVLPPHFTVGIEDEDVRNGLKSNFKWIFMMAQQDERSCLVSILMRCLASLVHHSDSLIDVIAKNPGHPFMNIPILSNGALLQRLKAKITTDPSPVIDSPTGIPPHVVQMRQLKDLLTHFKVEREARMNLEEKLVKTVQDTIEQQALTNGHITAASLNNILSKHQSDMNQKLQEERDIVDKKLDHLIQLVNRPFDPTATAPAPFPIVEEVQQQDEGCVREEVDEKGITRHLHYWNGKFWHVPQNFEFPKSCSRRRAWELWLIGMPNFITADGRKAPVMPFRRMKPKFLPKKVANKFKNEWVPCMTKMLNAPNLPEGIANANTLTPDKVEEAYAVGTDFLKSQVSYIFTKPKFKAHSTWSIGTWSQRLRYNEIQKYGTEEDIANLPEATKKNQSRKRK